MPNKPDIKITQDIKVVIAVLREAISRSPDKSINIINIGQIGSNQQLSQQQLSELEKDLLSVERITEQPEALEADVPRLMLPSKDTFDKALPEEHIINAVGDILNRIGGYRYNTVLKAMLLSAYRRYPNRKEAAKWLGIQYQTYRLWLNKLNIPKE